jgi:hypothetical protein
MFAPRFFPATIFAYEVEYKRVAAIASDERKAALIGS